MRNHIQTAPSIRFKGFADAWEQRKLGEISESYSGGTPSVVNHSYYGGSIPFIRSAEINSKNTELYLTEEGLNNSSAKLVEEGDILYALYGATSGEVGISQINGAINQAILAIKPKIEYDSNFIMQWLRRQKNSIISTYLQGGQGNLSGGIVKDLTLYAPTEYEEQTKIGSFFKQLDNTIALHQRQLSNYKEWKKALLQKMFPKDGEKRPEVRFEGFAGEWEERKVKDIFPEIFSGNRLPKTLLVEGEVPYIIAKVSNNGEFMKIDDKSLDYHGNKMKLFPFPSITFSIDNPEAIFVQKHPFFTSNIMRVLHNSSLSYNQNIFFHLCIKRLTTYFNWSIKFSGPVVMDSIVYVPINDTGDAINFDEVERVGAFFKQLDDTITLHQQQLDNYKELKKAMLQKMFI